MMFQISDPKGVAFLVFTSTSPAVVVRGESRQHLEDGPHEVHADLTPPQLLELSDALACASTLSEEFHAWWTAEFGSPPTPDQRELFAVASASYRAGRRQALREQDQEAAAE